MNLSGDVWQTLFELADMHERQSYGKCELEQPTSIRFHRACSWIARVEKDGVEDHDTDLLSLWIAFNSLYGQWDEQKREPRPDRECWRGFVSEILRLDESDYMADSLMEHRRLVMSLLEDEYLSGYFWEEPCAKRSGQSKKAMYDARTWYLEKRWTLILERVLERVYLMRCQLVHGAATHGSKLNRTSEKDGDLRSQLAAMLANLLKKGNFKKALMACKEQRVGKRRR